MQLVLDLLSGNERMPKFHDVLCFTIVSARTLLSECMFCTHDRCPAKSKSLKSTNLGACVDTSHMPDKADHVSNMIFVLHEPSGFEQKLSPFPLFLNRN